MNCNELLQALNEYVEGTVDPGLCSELQNHLAGCNPCQVVVDNIRKTITIYREGREVELPPGCRDRLHAALRERWFKTHPVCS